MECTVTWVRRGVLHVLFYNVGDAEFEDLSTGAWLETSTVVAYQQLLKKKFAIGGLDDPAYGQEYAFSTQRGHFVQVLHVNGNHWLCASNVLSVPGKHSCYTLINVVGG